ncbi:ATP-binding cassette domain-containing protein [Variovorax sp. CT11-76]
MASIKLQDITKNFADKHVVKGVSIDVPDGEFLVLLGPSGCGKSTLLRMLAGLESISGGEIHIAERRVDELPPSSGMWNHQRCCRMISGNAMLRRTVMCG